MTENEWLKQNGYIKSNDETRKKHYYGEQSWGVYDRDNNHVGRIDHGYRIGGANGSVTVDHVHLDSDSEKIHHYFENKKWFDDIKLIVITCN